MTITRLSSKGQIVLPSTIRVARGWKAGTEFTVEEAPDGVLLRPLRPYPQTRVQDVFGIAQFKGPRRSLEDMDAAVSAEARRRK